MARITPATRLRRRVLCVAATSAVVFAYLLFRKAEVFAHFRAGDDPPFVVLYTATFAWLLWTTLLAYAETPHRAPPELQGNLDDAQVTVLVPVYNEDPGWVRRSLQSLLDQTRRPDAVNICDDGSNVDYEAERAWFLAAAKRAGVRATWQRTANRGKRHAQITAADQSPDTAYFVTIDSDADLDRNCLHELLQPFADPRVQSSAAVVLSANTHANWLTRMFDLYAVTWQLTDRSTQSVLGSVAVNSGVCAAYRAALIRDHRHAYLNETFLGRPVAFSDDSLLTLFAKLRGRTVQQPSALALTAMPETVGHHLRQQLRWMRGSTIRAWWRVKYLPLTGYAFWNQVASWFLTLVGTCVFLWLFLVQPFTIGVPVWTLVTVPILLGYLRGLRYLAIRVHGESLRGRLGTFALAPLAVLWGFTVLRAVRWYGMATCARTGWGTRDVVEVHLATDRAHRAEALSSATGMPSARSQGFG
ncbi:glycosyltransferase [Uniformispora flossi]|uniref:glycosyltransferase n=1 Tax=Uniformispora flossi TaxID=3390723 RepID=UPI003C2D141F